MQPGRVEIPTYYHTVSMLPGTVKDAKYSMASGYGVCCREYSSPPVPPARNRSVAGGNPVYRSSPVLLRYEVKVVNDHDVRSSQVQYTPPPLHPPQLPCADSSLVSLPFFLSAVGEKGGLGRGGRQPLPVPAGLLRGVLDLRGAELGAFNTGRVSELASVAHEYAGDCSGAGEGVVFFLLGRKCTVCLTATNPRDVVPLWI